MPHVMNYRQMKNKMRFLDSERHNENDFISAFVNTNAFSKESYAIHEKTIVGRLHLGDDHVILLPPLFTDLIYHCVQSYTDPAHIIPPKPRGDMGEKDMERLRAANDMIIQVITRNEPISHVTLSFYFTKSKETHAVTALADSPRPLLALFVSDALGRMLFSVRDQNKPLTFIQQLLIKSGVSFGILNGEPGIMIPTLPFDDAELSTYFCPVRWIPQSRLQGHNPSEIREWVAQEPVESFVVAHFEFVNLMVVSRLAPAVLMLSEREQLSALLVAFDINRQALKGADLNQLIDLAFLKTPVQAIEDLLCFLYREDKPLKHHPRLGRGFSTTPKVALPIDELRSDDPLLVREMSQIEKRDPKNVFALLQAAVKYALTVNEKETISNDSIANALSVARLLDRG